MPLNREISTDEYLGTFKQSSETGEKRGRALALVDKLYRSGAIDIDKWTAAGALRNMLMMEMPPSEGVSSYGQSVKASDAAGKADRIGKRHTGFKIQPDGEILAPGAEGNPGGRKSRRNERALEDALFAACGVHDDDGQRRINVKHAEILIRVCTHTEDMPTQEKIGQELTPWHLDRKTGKMKPYYSGEKQLPPFAVGVINVWLGRLSMHLKLAKG